MAEVEISFVEGTMTEALRKIAVYAIPWYEPTWDDEWIVPLREWTDYIPIGRSWMQELPSGHLTSALGSATTVLMSPEFAKLPEMPAPGRTIILCLHRMMTELVEVTSHQYGSELVTVTRGARDTPAVAFPQGAQWSVAVTASS